MFQIDLKSRKPIYEQIVDNFRRLIISGALSQNERAPSVRDLAKVLACNPNTIQKAFRELEVRGYIYTVPGHGSYISEPPAESSGGKTEALLKSLDELVSELEFLGVNRKVIASRILPDNPGLLPDDTKIPPDNAEIPPDNSEIPTDNTENQLDNTESQLDNTENCSEGTDAAL